MFRFQLLISPVLVSFGNIFIDYEPSFAINGTVKTLNLQEYVRKIQHTEFIYAKNDGREKNKCAGMFMYKWTCVGTKNFQRKR